MKFAEASQKELKAVPQQYNGKHYLGSILEGIESNRGSEAEEKARV